MKLGTIVARDTASTTDVNKIYGVNALDIVQDMVQIVDSKPFIVLLIHHLADVALVDAAALNADPAYAALPNGSIAFFTAGGHAVKNDASALPGGLVYGQTDAAWA